MGKSFPKYFSKTKRWSLPSLNIISQTAMLLVHVCFWYAGKRSFMVMRLWLGIHWDILMFVQDNHYKTC